MTVNYATDLRFLQDTHQYFVGGTELISVTTALKHANLIDDDWFTETARLRGRYVHEACELVDDENLGEVDPLIAPYVAAYECFLRDVKPQWAYVEYRVHDPHRGYAGTLDRCGFLNGKWVILDIKTGGEHPWHGPQTAGYARLMPHSSGLKPDRYALYLRHDGSYRLKPLVARTDESTFFAALAIAQFRRAHGYRD